MNVSLSPDLAQIVNHKVAAGLYPSAGEVVREALLLLRERDEFRRIRLEELKRDVQEGLDALDRGEKRNGPEVFAAIKERHARRETHG